MRGFRQLSHTADVKIEAWGPDFSSALVECVRGFTSLVTDVNAVATIEKRAVSLTAKSREALLYDLIDQLVYLKDTETFLASSAEFSVAHKETWTLTGTLIGACLVGETLSDVKAMTYHDMKIDEKDGKVMVTYVVDL